MPKLHVPNRIVCRLGAPCSGKGAEGRALKHLYHGRVFGVVTMRDLIKTKSEQCDEFHAIALQCEKEGRLIPNEHIADLLANIPRLIRLPQGVLWLDGIPRDAEQVGMLKNTFPNTKIIVSESEASNEHLLKVFRATQDAPDRKDRLDGAETTHHARVDTYRKNLPAIRQRIKSLGWDHRVHSATLPLKERIQHLQEIAELPRLHHSLLRNIEEKIGLTPLDLSAA